MMLRKTFILLWLLAPVAILFYHFGTWGRALSNDQIISARLKEIEAHKANKKWKLVIAGYDKLIRNVNQIQQEIETRNKKRHSESAESEFKVVSENKKLTWRLRLEKSLTLLNTAELGKATGEIEDQLAEMNEAKQKGALISEVRNSLALCEYYCGWYMRLEGYSREEWMLETETSRQLFRMLAEQALKDGDPQQAIELQKNLEAVIRLERMDLSELFALPLPKNGAGIGSEKVGSQRGKKKAKGNGKGKKSGKGKKKAKKKHKRPKDSSNEFKPGEGS